MKKLMILSAFFLAAVLPASAQDSLSEAFFQAGTLKTSGADVPMPAGIAPSDNVQAPAAARAAAPKQWTIMVYIDGKNTLEEYIYTNMKQMESVGSSDKVNIVVEVGRMNGQGNDFHGDKDWTGCRRYLVKKGDGKGGIFSPVLQKMDKCDMGDYKHAIDFGKWAMTSFPAQHYAYVIWNHGGGWIKTVPGFTSTKAIALDDETKHLITTPQMNTIMKSLGHIDVYGSDACLMQMAEVIYELKDTTDFVVGSEKTEAGDGWDYAGLLNRFYASSMTGQDLATAIVDAYLPQYSSGATLSAVRSASMNGFASKLNAFVDAVIAAKDGKAVAAARDTALNMQEDGLPENKDLGDFVSIVVANSKDMNVQITGKALLASIKSMVVDNKVTSDYAKAKGVAIYAPDSGFDRDYNELQFASTKWISFIKFMQQAK